MPLVWVLLSLGNISDAERLYAVVLAALLPTVSATAAYRHATAVRIRYAGTHQR